MIENNNKEKIRCPSCGRMDAYWAFVEDGGMGYWCPHCKKSTEGRRSTKPLFIIVGVIGILIIFGVINLILYHTQNIIHKPGIERCEFLENKLKSMKEEIQGYEEKIKINIENHQKKEKNIDILEEKLKEPNSNYKSRNDYLKEYNNYKKLVVSYNKEINHINSLIQKYKGLIAEYNSDVEEYNKLAKKAYSRWYIIPIPGVKGKGVK